MLRLIAAIPLMCSDTIDQTKFGTLRLLARGRRNNDTATTVDKATACRCGLRLDLKIQSLSENCLITVRGGGLGAVA